MQQMVNDPDFIVEFAIGDPIPNLIPQSKDSGIRLSGVYFDEPKRYIMKSCHLSKDDVRILDVDTGKVVLVSHHPGKNPYEELDPLGIGNNPHAVNGGEWESCLHQTMHGQGDDSVIMNIGKMSKFETMSMRPHFEVGKGKDGDEVYVIAADMMERTFTIKNQNDEVVAQVAKTTKALIQNAVFGSGSESTIDIAPGVDTSAILAIVFGLGQVGAHFVKDSLNNYVVDPLKDQLMDNAVEAVPGMDQAVDMYEDAQGDAKHHAHALKKFQKFYESNFK
ncbi:hypothetical protein QTG54_012333 [Skeletonema marinoi]|uniref:Uncharacterized protein n=1 Tax=Skeletonema marinoi TaxID=267567 RepID=A0AAD9D8S6_9STRA|nr:hypothetical protein QTG54_012333 [Skeletonema marinoi]